jgi:hypothetical protein
MKMKKIAGMLMCGMFLLMTVTAQAGFNLGGITVRLPAGNSGSVGTSNQELPNTTATCDLPYAQCFAAPSMQIKVEGRTLVMIGKDIHKPGMTDENGKLDAGMPRYCVQGVIWKSGASHYFTFTRNPMVGPVNLVRHDVQTNSVDYREF